MSIKSRDDDDRSASLGLDKGSTQLRLIVLDHQPIDRAKAFGRIAFACPGKELSSIQTNAQTSDGKVITPLVSLDTPGKATVEVVILADPDGHEICFVGDEGFRQLSQVDPQANQLLQQAIIEDKSDQWFETRGGKPTS